jgi:hypothetical protein
MFLWILTQKKRAGLDEMRGVLIRAHTSHDARRRASFVSGDEGMDVWLDHKKTTCEQIQQEGEELVLLRDFNNG